MGDRLGRPQGAVSFYFLGFLSGFSSELLNNLCLTVAILAQGASWAVAVTQAFLQADVFDAGQSRIASCLDGTNRRKPRTATTVFYHPMVKILHVRQQSMLIVRGIVQWWRESRYPVLNALSMAWASNS